MNNNNYNLHSNINSISINRIRFCIIILILTNHINFSNNNHHFKIYDNSFLHISIASPTLAYLSGYLFFLNFKYDNFKFKLINRTKSLILPYVLWSFLLFFVYQLCIFFLRINNLSYLSSYHFDLFLIKDYFKILLYPQNIFWYLQNLILILPFSPIIFYIINRKYLFFIFLLIIIILMIHSNLFFSIRFLPYYLLGAYGSLRKKIIQYNVSINCIILILISLSIIYLFNLLDSDTFFIIIIQLFLVEIFINIIYNLFLNRIFNFINNYLKFSFFIFCTHIIISKFVIKTYTILFNNAFLDIQYGFYALSFLFFIIVFILSINFARLILFLYPKVFFILSGQRT